MASALAAVFRSGRVGSCELALFAYGSATQRTVSPAVRMFTIVLLGTFGIFHSVLPW